MPQPALRPFWRPYAQALFVITIVGGLYLLYLAYKSARAALSSTSPQPRTAPIPASRFALYRLGLLLHLTNPKAVLAWIAIMSLGLRLDAAPYMLHAIVIGCAVLGVIVFGSYALVFSTLPMERAYQKARRWIEVTLAAFFGYAGIRLLLSRA